LVDVQLCHLKRSVEAKLKSRPASKEARIATVFGQKKKKKERKKSNVMLTRIGARGVRTQK
jgi:hypothetical protein